MRRLLSLAVLAVALAACGGSRPNSPSAAPSFELEDLSGKKVRLQDFRGRPVLLDFWATWCGPCRLSIPAVQDFYRRHQQEGLMVLGITMDDDRGDVFPFVERFKMTYPVLYAGASSVGGDYQVQGIPTFVFIDQQGQIVEKYEGFHSDMPKAWEAELRRLLEQQS